MFSAFQKTPFSIWHVSDFHISDARGNKDSVGYNEQLSATGDNLQLVTQHIFMRSAFF